MSLLSEYTELRGQRFLLVCCRRNLSVNADYIEEGWNNGHQDFHFLRFLFYIAVLKNLLCKMMSTSDMDMNMSR